VDPDQQHGWLEHHEALVTWCCTAGIPCRYEAVQVPLEQATPDQQLVGSLVTMWQQERWRLGGSSIPPPPDSPRRHPQTLSPAVEAVRQEFRVG
jgi:hypothetical protein